MPTSTSSVLVAASFCAVVPAQSPASFQQPIPLPELAITGGGGNEAAATTGGTLDDIGIRSLRAAQQEPDYSLRGLFQQTHGDFMLRRERFEPSIKIGGSSLTSAAVQHEPGHFDMLQLRGDFATPMMVSPEAYVEVGAFYHSRHYQAHNMVGFGNETLFDAGIKAGFGWFLDSDILLEAEFTPGVWSDLDGTLHKKDFDYPASGLLTVRYSNELFWKIGARYNEVFEDANILPWLGFSFVGEVVRVDLLAPEKFEVSLWPSPDFGVLFGTQIQGAEYHVRSSSSTTPPHQRADARVQEVLLYTGALWRTSDNLSFEARIGASVAGDYKLDDGDPSTKRVTGTLEPALFLDISMGIDF